MNRRHVNRLMLALLLALVGCDEDSVADGVQDAQPMEMDPADLGADASPMSDQPDAGASGPWVLQDDLCSDPRALERLLELAPALSGQDGSALGDLNQETLRQMLAAPTEGPFYMVNLIRYRAQAEYADGRQTDLTGREADSLYAPIEFLSAIGAQVVFVGDVGETLLGEAGAWETVAIVEYPCPLAFFAMTSDPGFRARLVHKDAGVEATIVMWTRLQPSPLPEDFTPSESPFPGSAEDPPFEMIHVLRYREQAQYMPGSDEPARSGREAMDLYTEGATEAANRLGVYPTAWFEVRGVVIGDGRPWDEVRLNHMPSRAGFDALVADPGRLAGQHHRNAALEDTYALITYPTISSIPGGPMDGSNPSPPPITEDGTGTLCRSDEDCPEAGPNTCLSVQGQGGFCTIEGCEVGSCAAPYVCCRECSPQVQALLPFEGSACLPEAFTAQLIAAPANCTCD